MDQETFDLLRATVRRFVDARLIPAEDRVENEDAVPPEHHRRDARAWLVWALGAGGIWRAWAHHGRRRPAIIRELTRASVVFRSVIGTTVGIGSQGIVMDGTEAQKREWLPKLATGEAISSFALTEPEAGSDAASLRKTAARDGDNYRINGTKRFITNAPRATRVHTDGAHRTRSERREGHFRVHRAGEYARHQPRQAGQEDGPEGRAHHGCDLRRLHCAGELDCRRRARPGFTTAMKVLDRGRIHIAAVALGMCDRLIDMSVRYATERKQFGQAISGVSTGAGHAGG